MMAHKARDFLTGIDAGKAQPLREALIFPHQIIRHEKPSWQTVHAIAAAMLAGEKMPPIEVDPRFCEHWRQGPTGMVSTGIGHGLIDGHHRLAAHVKVFGKNTPIRVRFFGKDLIEGPATQALQAMLNVSLRKPASP